MCEREREIGTCFRVVWILVRMALERFLSVSSGNLQTKCKAKLSP